MQCKKSQHKKLSCQNLKVQNLWDMDDKLILYLFTNEFSHSCTHPFRNILNGLLIPAEAVEHNELNTGDGFSQKQRHSIQINFMMFILKNFEKLESLYLFPNEKVTKEFFL